MLLCQDVDNTGSNGSTCTSRRCALGARALRLFKDLLTSNLFCSLVSDICRELRVLNAYPGMNASAWPSHSKKINIIIRLHYNMAVQGYAR